MPAPFYNAIKGTTSGTPGTGAFTPNAAATNFIAWSTVASGWVGLVRYEDGSAWELSYGYWNATTITRPSTGFVASSTGSQLSLTSAATAAFIVDGMEVQSHLGGMRWAVVNTIPNNSSTGLGITAPTTTGTATSTSLGTGSFAAEQARIRIDSATTANAQAGYSWPTTYGVYNTTAGRGGFEFSCRLGPGTLPTGPRAFFGMTGSTYVASTAEPSAFASSFAVIGKDSTDTNLQFMTNSGATAGKTDTGIPLTATAWYEMTIWSPPGGGSVSCLLIRLDDPSGSNIFYATRTTSLLTSPVSLFPNVLVGLNGTNTGTAAQLFFGSMAIRTGT